MIATLGTLMGGMFRGFMVELAAHKVYGGGPIEALIRLVTQQNVTSEMEPGLRTTAAQTVDKVLESGLSVVAAMLPEFGRFDLAKFVAGGFDIPADVILSCVFQAAGFLLPVFVAGYFFLKTREVAR